MLNPGTFLMALYVMVDDLCQEHLPAGERPRLGRPVSLCRSEVLTLALFGQWYVFPSERAFFRWASRRLLSLFPFLCDQSQFHRLARHHTPATVAFLRYLARRLGQESTPYEAIDRVCLHPCGLLCDPHYVEKIHAWVRRLHVVPGDVGRDHRLHPRGDPHRRRPEGQAAEGVSSLHGAAI